MGGRALKKVMRREVLLVQVHTVYKYTSGVWTLMQKGTQDTKVCTCTIVRRFFFYSNSRPPARTIRLQIFCETKFKTGGKKPMLTYTITEYLLTRSGFARSGPIYCHLYATILLMPTAYRHTSWYQNLFIVIFKKWRLCSPFLHTSFVSWWHVKNNWVSPRNIFGVMKWKSTVENSGLLGAQWLISRSSLALILQNAFAACALDAR